MKINQLKTIKTISSFRFISNFKYTPNNSNFNQNSNANAKSEFDSNVYGYRKSKVYEMQDYTLEEQLNRSQNANLFRLVYAFRSYGHLAADLDPLGIQSKRNVPELEPARYSIPDTNARYDVTGIAFKVVCHSSVVDLGILHVGKKSDVSLPILNASISQIVSHLQKTYCGKIAYEFRHIPNVSERRWFAHMIESFDKKTFSKDEKKRILNLLVRSQVFDQFMSKRFTQVKRYGLEGAESMMVALDNLFRSSSHAGVIEAVVCMPHRGRLNLLTDLFEYNPTALFHKIKGNNEFPEEFKVNGDVLSHIANSVHLTYENSPRSLHVTMLHNPSHLEAVNPVAMGKSRAKQMDMYESKTEGSECNIGDRVICIQLHGDAAFTGQGVVMESLGLSNLPHFTSGGSIHLVVNNQIGYTTPAMNSRSSIYASDVGKMINAPVIHVNGDYPEEVAYAAMLAFEYRNKFRKDVILDLITYRRWGHNELDEPAFTQPLMYKNIRDRKSVPHLYEEKMINEKVISGPDEAEEIRRVYLEKLDEHLENSKSYEPQADYLRGKWSSMIHPTEAISRIDTGLKEETMSSIGNASVDTPPEFSVHPRLIKHHVESRRKMMETGSKLDWATAEAIALGSLLVEGYNVRLSGQDVGRGTFSQRHCMLVDQDDEGTYIPLNNIPNQKGKMEVANSSLSEFAVLGFEYGMSLESPNSLNIWEAQFGDFFNGAQVIIDTYINSGEQKWLRQSGLVLLLPHGFDGAGPEHSSCRMERFLQLSDDKFDGSDMRPHNINWHIINPTTPAQYFHALRRQMKRPFRKPLIVVAPKTLLKLSAATSDFDEMTPGTSFEPVLLEPISDPNTVEKVVFMSGKLYYDLIKAKETGRVGEKVALVRLEELCPFPRDELSRTIPYYPNAKEYVWCQEEPQNMGAYTFIEPRLRSLLPHGASLKYIGREAAAAPATGVGKRHKQEVEKLMNDFLNLGK